MGDSVEFEPEWRTLKRKWEHSFHPMCSYMGMFPASLPHYFIQKLTDEGDRVLDPFSGRGTTALQACVDGRHGIGNDLNPLAYTLTRAKVRAPPAPEIQDRIAELHESFDDPNLDHVPEEIRMLFHDRTLAQLEHIKREFGLYDVAVTELSDVDIFISALILGIMHGQTRQYFSIPMPNTFSMSKNYLKEYIEDEGLEPPNVNAFFTIQDRLKKIYKSGRPPVRGEAYMSDAIELPDVPENSIDLVFTSPPYLKVIKYGLYNWIRLWFLDRTPDAVDEELDDELDLEEYLAFMEGVAKRTSNVLKDDGGVAGFVIGDVDQNGDHINLAREVWDNVFEPMDEFEKYAIIEDRIDDNEKVSRIWGDTKGEATEIDRILLLYKGSIDIKSNPDGLKTKSLVGEQSTLTSF